MRPNFFYDVEILVAGRIMHNRVEMIGAESLNGASCPQAFLVILDERHAVRQPATIAFAEPFLCIPTDHLLEPALIHMRSAALRGSILG